MHLNKTIQYHKHVHSLRHWVNDHLPQYLAPYADTASLPCHVLLCLNDPGCACLHEQDRELMSVCTVIKQCLKA